MHFCEDFGAKIQVFHAFLRTKNSSFGAKIQISQLVRFCHIPIFWTKIRFWSQCEWVRKVKLICLQMRFSFYFVSVTVSELCTRSEKHNFLSNIPKPIDGAVVISSNERDVDCVVTFQTESILERFMIRFDDLKIDCNDKLVIYDGAHAIGKFMVSWAFRIIDSEKSKVDKSF